MHGSNGLYTAQIFLQICADQRGSFARPDEDEDIARLLCRLFSNAREEFNQREGKV